MEIRARFDFNFGRNVSNLVVQFVSSMSRVAALPRVCLLLRLLRTELAVLGRPSASLPWRLVESSQQLAAVTVSGGDLVQVIQTTSPAPSVSQSRFY